MAGDAERLARVEATLALQELKARYAELVDARTAGGSPKPQPVLDRIAAEIADLFTPDGVWDGGPGLGVAAGRAEIAARLAHPTVRFAVHVFAQPRLSIDPGARTGSGRWTLVSPFTRADGSSYLLIGEEHDRYAYLDGAWRHASMRLAVTSLTPLPDGWGRSAG